MDDGSTESHKYYLGRKTMLEMLRDRGFAVPNCEIDVSLQEFRDKYGQKPADTAINELRIAALHKDDPSIKVHVLFFGRGEVKVKHVRGIAADIVNKDTLNRLILAVESKITSQAMKALELFKFKVEIFQITDLLVNITKHELKPKHQVLTKREKQNLLNKYSIDEKQQLYVITDWRKDRL